MADTGGGTGAVLEGLAAIITAGVVAGGFVVSLFRRKDNSDDATKAIVDAVEAGLLEARLEAAHDALAARDYDRDRQDRRIHQLEDFIVSTGHTPPRRLDDA